MTNWGGWKGWGLLMALSGCASTPFRGPESGGSRWTEATSPHFRVLSSQSDSSVRESLQELEVAYAALEQVAFPSSDNPGGIVELIMLPRSDFELLNAKRSRRANVAGFFTSHEEFSDGAPRLVVKEGMGEQSLQVLQHELTHRFVAFHFPNAPIWLNEGLASFWESMEVRHGKLSFGGTVRTRVKPTRYPDLLKLRGDEFYQGDEFDVHANYVAAEALTYVLYFQRREPFKAYLNGLKSGTEATSAWSNALEAFDLDPKAIEADYYQFFRERGTLATLPAPTVNVEVDVTEMSPSNLHLTWASLFHHVGALEEARRHATSAIELDSLSADALVTRARIATTSNQLNEAKADLERAITLEPPRSSALSAALRFSLQTGQKLSVPDKELAQRLLRFQLKPSQQALVAEQLRRDGDFERGIRLTSNAVRADSSCFYCYATGARLLADKGELKQAAAALRVALSLAGERATKGDWHRLYELEAAATREEPAAP